MVLSSVSVRPLVVLDMERHCFVLVCVLISVFAGSVSSSCNDKNTLTDGPVCSQICTENKTTDTYNCSCKNGYELDSGTGACHVEGEAAMLFYKNQSGLFTQNLDTGLHYLVKEGIGHISRMEFGPNNTIFWIEDQNPAVYSMEIDPESFQGSEITPIIDAGLLSPSGLSVDWVTSTLYVLDSKLGEIIACSTKGENCSVIISNLNNPQDLTIYRETRMLIWITKSPPSGSGTVNMAKLDGKGHIIFMTGLKAPHSFMLDETIGTFFWISAENDEHVIQGMYLKNRRTTTITKISKSEISGLSVLGDTIYLWTDTGIQALNKFTGLVVQNVTFNVSGIETVKVYHTVLYESIHKVFGDTIYLWTDMGIQRLNKFTGQVVQNTTYDVSGIETVKVYHTVLFESKDKDLGIQRLNKLETVNVLYESIHKDNPCVRSSCSHLCLPGAGYSNKYSCPCPTHMTHISNTQCTDVMQERRIMVSGLKGIFEVPVDFIGRSQFAVKQLTNQSAGCMVYDPISNELIYYDFHQYNIMIMDLSVPGSAPRIMYSDIINLEGLAFNERDNVLYWTTLMGKVFTSSKNTGSEPVVLYDTFRNPRGITVDSKKGLLYICDWRNDPKIYKCDTLGTLCEALIRVPDGHPNMIMLTEGNQLYWTDSKRDKIGLLDLNRNRSSEIDLFNTRNPHPFCIGSTKSRVYFTDLNSRQLHYFYKSKPEALYNLHLNLGTLFGLAVVSVEHQRESHKGPAILYGQTDKSTAPTQPNIIIARPKHTTPKTVLIMKGLNGTYNNTDSIDLIPAPPQTVKVEDKRSDVGLALLIVFLVIGLSLLVAVLTWFCYWKQRQSKSEWIEKLVRFVKPSPERCDDGEELLPSSLLSSNPSFKHFDDVDYPVMSRDKRRYDVNMNTSQGSRDSEDSAFTEIQDSPPTMVY